MKNSIAADLKKRHGIECTQITPVSGGWLNEKWRVSTNKGELLIKQFSMERFSRERLEVIETALQRQVMLRESGVLCPFILQSEGKIINWVNDEPYMVMEFMPGEVRKAENITSVQMKSLGNSCAVMHKAFSGIPEPADKVLPVFGGYSLDLLWEHFNSHKKKCQEDTDTEYRKALLALEPILKQLDQVFFDKFSKGFTHEDIQTGNILFSENAVSAIIDFDRNCYSYTWHDIGIAILSFALDGETLNTEKVQAFIDGYSQHLPLTLSDIADALRISWCIETVWWIQPEFFGECSEVAKRFKEEVVWLTKNWFDLNSVLN